MNRLINRCIDRLINCYIDRRACRGRRARRSRRRGGRGGRGRSARAGREGRAEATVSSRLEIRVRPPAPDAASPALAGNTVKIHSVVSGGEVRLNHDEASVYYDATEHQRDKRSSTRSGEKSQSPAIERTRLDAIPDRSTSAARGAGGDGTHSLRDRSTSSTSRIPVASPAHPPHPPAGGAHPPAAAGGAHRLAKCASWSGDPPLSPDTTPHTADLTPALRRRRQNAADKYAADPARDLNLRFARPRRRHPPHASATSRCRSVTIGSSPPPGSSSSSGSPPPAPPGGPPGPLAGPPAPPAGPPLHNAARARRFRPSKDGKEELPAPVYSAVVCNADCEVPDTDCDEASKHL
ncbi:unnamed protein product, partial [Brenthis ino]